MHIPDGWRAFSRKNKIGIVLDPAPVNERSAGKMPQKGETDDEYNLESQKAKFSGLAVDVYYLWVFRGSAVHKDRGAEYP